METKFIQFWGGPGTGKSSTASYLFSWFKNNDRETPVEFVPEYTKALVYSKKVDEIDWQFFYNLQRTAMEGLIGKVKYVFVENPIDLFGFYKKDLNVDNSIFREYVVDVFLERVRDYMEYGRYQSEDSAKKLDYEMEIYVETIGRKIVRVPANHEGQQVLLNMLKAGEI